MDVVSLTPLLALCLGFAMAWVNSCTVAATERLVFEKNPDWLGGLFVAGSLAGLTLFGLSLAFGGAFALPKPYLVDGLILGGGIILGIGAVVNGACMLGSISWIGRGNLNFLFTLAGMLLAFEVVRSMPELAVSEIDGSAGRGYDKPVSIGFLTAFMAFAIFAFWRLIKANERQYVPIVLIGVLGALMYASSPDWSYASVLAGISENGLPSKPGHLEFATMAVFAGGAIGAISRDHFNLVWPSPLKAVRCIAGGTLMGIGASLIPGGNDTLLLWTIPGLAIHGLVAFIAMVLATAVGLILAGAISKGTYLPKNGKEN